MAVRLPSDFLWMDESLEDLVGEETAAGSEANGVSVAFEQSGCGKVGDCGASRGESFLAEHRAEFLQIDSSGQAQAEKEEFFESGLVGDDGVQQWRVIDELFQGIGG